jgi:hypothetical protein
MYRDSSLEDDMCAANPLKGCNNGNNNSCAAIVEDGRK